MPKRDYVTVRDIVKLTRIAGRSGSGLLSHLTNTLTYLFLSIDIANSCLFMGF